MLGGTFSFFRRNVVAFDESLTLPPISVQTGEDARKALTAVIGAMAAGEITGAEAAVVMRPIQMFLETLVVEMTENRIAEMVKRERC